MPVIRAQGLIREMTPGDQLVVTATDPGARADLTSFSNVHGHTVLSIVEDGSTLKITIEI